MFKWLKKMKQAIASKIKSDRVWKKISVNFDLEPKEEQKQLTLGDRLHTIIITRWLSEVKKDGHSIDYAEKRQRIEALLKEAKEHEANGNTDSQKLIYVLAEESQKVVNSSFEDEDPELQEGPKLFGLNDKVRKALTKKGYTLEKIKGKVEKTNIYEIT